MKTKLIVSAVGIAVLAFLAGRFVAPAHVPSTETASAAPHAPSPAPQKWTCSMHPQIQQPEPGDCPICGMDLIPLEDDSAADEGPRTMSMSEASRALAEIQTTEVVRDFPTAETRLVGTLEYDETREKSLTARFPARIDELFVNYTGIRVQQGEHLAKVYSPELLTAQRELLTAHQANPQSSITQAARDKLRLWDLLPEQIEGILQRGEATDNFVLKAPISGIVVEKHIREGDYVKLGQPLFRIVDLSTLWAELDAYESDMPWLRYGQDVSFTVESFPGETFHGTIAFIEPEVNRRTRTVPIRVNVPNTDGRLKPGMFVRATVAARLAGDGKVDAPEFAGKWISPMHPEIVKDHPGQCDVCGMDLVPAEELGYVDSAARSAPLIVPTSAVLRTGKRAVVYVEKAARGTGQGAEAENPTGRVTYEGREIVLGPRADQHFIVVAGLEAGERVVTHGAFKIDSALQIQAKPSMMNPEGGTVNGARDEGRGESGARDGGRGARGESESPLPIAADQLDALLPHYLELQQALAGDDLDSAMDALKALMQVTGHEGPLAKLIHDMMAAEDLAGIRRPHFETLSNALIAAIEKQPSSLAPSPSPLAPRPSSLATSPSSLAPSPSPLYHMHCPMVYDDHGADWLQATEQLRNPYFGASMLKCGEVKGTWGTEK